MSREDENPRRWRKRIKRFCMITFLMSISFGLGAATTAVLVLPIAMTGITMGMVGLVSVGASGTTNALYNGDSQTRQTLLTQLKESLTSQTPQKFDPQVAAWIVPALNQCKTDSDPNVVALAEELIQFIEINTINAGQ